MTQEHEQLHILTYRMDGCHVLVPFNIPLQDLKEGFELSWIHP